MTTYYSSAKVEVSSFSALLQDLEVITGDPAAINHLVVANIAIVWLKLLSLG